MKKKRIFNKKKKIINFYLLIIILFVFFVIIYFNIFEEKSRIFQISINNENFYIIPEDKGGIKVKNLDKKSLNQLDKEINILNNKTIDPNLKYSIQLFASPNYEEVFEQFKEHQNKEIYENDDLNIVIYNHELAFDFFLIYKNFNSRQNALEYCNKYLKYNNNCNIINVQKFK